MALLYILAALASSGDSTPRCDIIEINHKHSDGEICFTQVIAWDWSYDYHRKHAQGWMIVKEWTRTSTGIKFLTDNGKVMVLNAPSFIQTWTNYDPEVENKKLFPEKYRRKVWQ